MIEQKYFKILRNEDGFILVIALLLLSILTVIGFASNNTTNVELQIAGNEKRYKTNLYKAEGASFQAAQLVEDATTTQLADRTLPGLIVAGSLTNSDITDSSNWVQGGNAQNGWDSEAKYLIVERGVASGGSLKVTGSQLHSLSISGRSESSSGQGSMTVTIGYKRRY